MPAKASGGRFAKAFASAGARVVIAERNAEKARDVEQEIASGNGKALVVETDVADEDSVNAPGRERSIRPSAAPTC